jgi:Tol biopolymer transport system component
VLVNYDEDVYELSLADGKERQIRGISGKSLALSPDKKKIAFIKSNRVFTALINGGSKKTVLDLPPEWKPATDYKGMGEHPPMWSPTGDGLVLFGENQLLIARF